MDASNSAESQPQEVDSGKTPPKKGQQKDDGPSINITMPSKEWLDDLWGPMMIVEEDGDGNDEQNQQNTSTESKSRSRTPQLPATISTTNVRPKSKSNKAHDVVVISDDEEEKKKNQQNVKSNENMELQIIENPNNVEKTTNGHLLNEFSTREENVDNENKAKPGEIRQIVLTRAQLSQLAKCNNELFRKAVIGCYVRVNAPSILPDKYKDLLFLDQIVDILEPQSYQHFWFNRRFRLKYFGDFQIEQIHELAIQKDTELRAWFCCMEAKGIPIPSQEFVKRKKLELLAAQKEIETKNISPTPTKTKITRTDLGKIVLNQNTLSSLSKLPFDQFKKAVVGNFVCIQALRSGIPDDCQYHIIRVADCTQRREEYKVGNISIVNYQLVLPFYGNYIIPWLRTNFKEVTDAGFRRWIEDMKSWNQPIPTVAEINEKAAELQMALTEAESIPDYAQKKKKQKEEEEKKKRANLPIRFAMDLDKNLLKQQNLQKLAIFAQKDFDLFEKTMVGSFVRLKVGAKQFQVDRIRALELVELKPPTQNEEDEIIFDEKWEPTFEEKVSIELKYGGGTSLKELINNSSAFNFAQTEFDEWLRKMHDDPLCRPIPTYALIEKKEEDNNRALELAEKMVAEQQKKSNESTSAAQSKNNKQRNVEEVRILNTTNNGAAATLPKIPKKPIAEEGGRSRGGGGGGGGPSYSQQNQWKPRKEVRETPGIRSGWMNSTSSSSSTINPLRQQWRQSQTAQNEFNRPQRWTTPQPLAQRVISEPNQINFVPERNPWVPSGEQHKQIQNLEHSLGFYHDQFGRIGSNPVIASSSTSFAASDDALRRAIPNDRLPQLISQRGLSSMSSSAGYAAHYNAAPSYSQPTYFSPAAPKRARQSSPQPPPVHRIF